MNLYLKQAPGEIFQKYSEDQIMYAFLFLALKNTTRRKSRRL
jgi:hypothetical protein